MPDRDADIIEGEVIEETPQSETMAGKQPANKSGRAGWYVAGLLTAFIGGMVAFPYAREGLISLGIIPPPPPVLKGVSAPDYTPIIEDLRKASVRHAEMLAQLSKDLKNRAADTTPSSDAVDMKPVLTELDSLKQRLADQEALLLQMGQAGHSSAEKGASFIAVETLKNELASLKNELAKSEQAQKDALLRFTHRLDGVEAGSIAGTPRGQLYLAMQDVRTAALDGQTVTGMINRILTNERYLGEAELVAELETLRDWFSEHTDAVASLASLQSDYDSAVRAFTKARHKEEGNFLMGLFTVRETGESATGDDALILRAEKRLKSGDIAGAIDEITLLEAAAKLHFNEWLQEAKFRLEVQDKLDAFLADVRGRVN